MALVARHRINPFYLIYNGWRECHAIFFPIFFYLWNLMSLIYLAAFFLNSGSFLLVIVLPRVIISLYQTLKVQGKPQTTPPLSQSVGYLFLSLYIHPLSYSLRLYNLVLACVWSFISSICSSLCASFIWKRSYIQYHILPTTSGAFICYLSTHSLKVYWQNTVNVFGLGLIRKL